MDFRIKQMFLRFPRKMRMKRKAYFTFTKHSQNSILVATERHWANAKLKWISENKNSLFKEEKMKIGIKKWARNKKMCL